jgi:hypothetical protein
MQAQQTIRTVQYKPTDGAFSYENNKSLPFIINAVQPYALDELGRAIASFRPELSPIAHYLSALLTEAQAEMPIAVGSTHVFGSFDVLRDQPDNELKTVSVLFMAIRNPLRLFARRMPLSDFLTRYGDAVLRYGTILNALAESHAEVGEKLVERNAYARALAGVEPQEPFSHTLALLRELAAEHDWEALREQAERHLDTSDPAVATEARRMLALSLAQSPDATDKARSVETYRALTESGQASATDFAALASLLTAATDYEGAKAVLMTGMEKFPDSASGFLAVGQTIVEATGDRAFRDELNARQTGRRTA